MSFQQAKEYFFALMWGVIITLLAAGFLYLRREEMNVYILNKGIASSAAAMLSIVWIIGPLSRLFDRFDHWVQYRREMGITSFFIALVHALLSYLYLQENFPKEYFQNNLVAILLGLAALSILFYLFVLSFESVVKLIDRKTWWSIHNWGLRLIMLLVTSHLILLKWAGWHRWYTSPPSESLIRPYLPPGSWLFMIFIIYAFSFRLSEFAGLVWGRRIVYATSIIFPLIIIGSILGHLYYWQ